MNLKLCPPHFPTKIVSTINDAAQNPSTTHLHSRLTVALQIDFLTRVATITVYLAWHTATVNNYYYLTIHLWDPLTEWISRLRWPAANFYVHRNPFFTNCFRFRRKLPLRGNTNGNYLGLIAPKCALGSAGHVGGWKYTWNSYTCSNSDEIYV